MKAIVLPPLLLLVTACGGNPCADIKGTCVALEIRGSGSIDRVDQLSILASGAASGAKIIASSKIADLPTLVAVELTAPVTTVLDVDVTGSLLGRTVGQGSKRITIAPGNKVNAFVTLVADTSRTTDDGTTGGTDDRVATAASLSVASTTIVEDDNGDGFVSPGEEGRIRIGLRNAGTMSAGDVRGTLTTTRMDIVITNGVGLLFDEIEGGATSCGVVSTNASSAGFCSSSETGYGFYYPSFSVPSSVPVGTTITFTLTLNDATNVSQTLMFNYTVQAIKQSFTVAAVDVVEDSNDDGVVSPGEKGNLRIQVINNGSSTASTVKGTLTTTAAGVTVSNGVNLGFDDIQSGSGKCGVVVTNPGSAGFCSSSDSGYGFYYPAFEVPTTLAVGTVVAFSLALKDEFNNAFSLSFNYTLQPIEQVLSLESATIVEDTDDSGAVTPGEEGSIRIGIQNLGGSRALGVRATLTTSTPGVTVSNGTNMGFGDIAPGETQCGVVSTNPGSAGFCSTGTGAYGFYYPSFSLSNSVTSGTLVSFDLSVSDTYGNTFPRTIDYQVP